jgi:hypothetical protein
METEQRRRGGIIRLTSGAHMVRIGLMKPLDWLLIVAIGCILIVVSPFVLLFVHQGIASCCCWRLRKHCLRVGLTPIVGRYRPHRDPDGVKTESLEFEVACRTASGEPRLVRSIVWPFGIRKFEVLETDSAYDSLFSRIMEGRGEIQERDKVDSGSESDA